jgi:tetratricopeptide (TPR) repeat protein
MDMGKASMGEFSTEARELEIPLSESQDVVQAPSKEDVQRTESALRKFMALVDEYPLLVRLAVGLNEGDCDADELTDQASNFYLFELAELHHYDPVAMLNGLVAISFGQLEERLQRLLCNVSVYRLPFTAMAATVMLKETALNWRDVAAQQFVEQDLQQLVKKSLLQVTEKPDRRYQVQPSIASALQQQASDWSWAHERAIFFYRSIAKVGCLRSEAEAQPYLETFYHHCELQQFSLASRVLTLCHGFLTARGHYDLLVELYERLLQGWHPTQTQECSEFSAALDNLGAVHTALGQYSQAMSRYEQALAMQGEIGDCNGEANSLMGLGNVCGLCDQPNRAITLYEQSIAIRRKQVGYNPGDWIQQQQGEAHAWFKLGKTLAKVNRADDALAAYRNARQLYGEIGLKNNMIACNQAIRQLTSLSKRLQRHLVLPLERIFRQQGRLGNA